MQIINTQPITLRIENEQYEFVKPKYLLKLDELKLIEAKVKGSTIVWNLGKTQVSYNQIKKALIELRAAKTNCNYEKTIL